MLEKYAGAIYRQLIPVLPNDWEKIAMLGKIIDNSYEFVFYVRRRDENKYVQCYTLEHEGKIDGVQLRNAFKEIYEICVKARFEQAAESRTDGIDPGKKWTSFTFLLNKDGDFSIDFGYDEYQLGVSSDWKAKYLD